MKSKRPEAVLVTGATSGIGLAAARALRDAGCTVYGTGRREGFSEPGISFIRSDVTDDADVDAAVAHILDERGRLDAVVNNAGFGISGAVEFMPVDDVKRLFDVDFFGLVRVARAVLPVFRRQGRGRIVNVTSAAACVPLPFQAAYSAAKAAANAWSMALANEVRHLGIGVTAVLPGDVRTGFTAAREDIAAGDDAYGGMVSRGVGRMRRDEARGLSPEYMGRAVARAVLRRSCPPIQVPSFYYGAVVLLTRLLPAAFVNRAIRRYYLGRGS